MSNSWWPHGLQHTRPTCPSRIPRFKVMSIESVMLSNHLILCHPLLLLPSSFPSIRFFPWVDSSIGWPKYWNFSISPSWLPCPWDSPGKNTGVGCHFLLQCMEVRSESEVAQSCPALSDPMNCSPPGSSIHGIFQARVLEWVAIAFYANLLYEWLNLSALLHFTKFNLYQEDLVWPSGIL